jgi:hypothetical protein
MSASLVQVHGRPVAAFEGAATEVDEETLLAPRFIIQSGKLNFTAKGIFFSIFFSSFLLFSLCPMSFFKRVHLKQESTFFYLLSFLPIGFYFAGRFLKLSEEQKWKERRGFGCACVHPNIGSYKKKILKVDFNA